MLHISRLYTALPIRLRRDHVCLSRNPPPTRKNRDERNEPDSTAMGTVESAAAEDRNPSQLKCVFTLSRSFHEPKPVTCRSLLRAAACALWALATVGGCSNMPLSPESDSRLPDYASVVADPIRGEEDRIADERRKPVHFLRFTQVQRGMNVLDVSAGSGYTAQLLALAVGPSGAVFAQTSQVRPGLDKRLAAHPQANIHVLVRGFEDPYPANAPRLDLVTFVLNYHDIAHQPVDRDRMNRALFDALKPGGHLVLIDHAAQPGSGLRDTATLHRIDQAVVQQELERAGFVLQQQSDFLRNPADPHQQAFFDMKTPTDRFALRFLRPQ
jgi:predicted methyltransferase